MVAVCLASRRTIGRPLLGSAAEAPAAAAQFGRDVAYQDPRAFAVVCEAEVITPTRCPGLMAWTYFPPESGAAPFTLVMARGNEIPPQLMAAPLLFQRAAAAFFQAAAIARAAPGFSLN
jgi:hypothetical protein